MNLRRLNEELTKLLEEKNKEYTFADWYKKDLTGQTYEGDLNCQNKGLTSLKGCPKQIKGAFQCQDNKLTSLQGAPEVADAFYCQNNNLTTLEGAPKEVSGYFNCSNNPLQDLYGIPNKIGILVAEGLDYKKLDLNILKDIQVDKIMPKTLSAVISDFGVEPIIKDIIQSANKGYYKYCMNRRKKGTNFENTENVLGYYSLKNLDGNHKQYKGKLTSSNLDDQVLMSVKNSINKRFNPFTLSINDYTYTISW